MTLTTTPATDLYVKWMRSSALTAWVYQSSNLAVSSGGALTNASGSIASDVGFSATTLTTFLTTASLAVGTWIIHVGVNLMSSGDNEAVDIEVANGTATATFSGQASNGIFILQNYSGWTLSLDFIATVTVAGTLIVECYCGGAGNVKATSYAQGYAKATGYTAVKIG